MKATTAEHKKQSSCLLRALALTCVVAITLGITLNRSQLNDFAALGYAGGFLAMLTSNATLILPAPGLVVIFALGSTLNPVLIGLVGAAGATLGEMTGYLTGYSGTALMERTPIAERIDLWMGRNGTLTIFALSVVPNPFFDLAGLFAGAARMPLIRFLGATFCGKSIQSIAIAYTGLLSVDWVEKLLAH